MYVFIDIDGVFVKEDKPGEITELEEDVPTLDRVCVDHFAHVLDQYERVQIVISSSWREIFDISTIRSRFPESIRRKITGATPIFSNSWSDSTDFFRYQEVLRYLELANATNAPWIAVDDIAQHYPSNVLIVVTDPYRGFDELSALQLDNF